MRLGAAIAMFMQGTQKERHSPTAFAPWRTAVSISMALMPNAPSPLTEINSCEGGSDAEGHAHAEATESAGVHVGTGGEPDFGEAQEVASVGDRDVSCSATLAIASKIQRGWILPSAATAGSSPPPEDARAR